MHKVFTGFVVVVLTLTGCVTAQDIQANAETELNTWAVKAGYAPLSCTGSDSDQNGYVSCDAKDLKTGQVIQLECAYNSLNTGCKTVRYQIPVGSQQ